MTMRSIDSMFCIMRVINASNEPLNTNQISVKTMVNPRGVQRYAMRLAKEGLVQIRNKPKGRGYEYYRNGLRVS